MRPKDGSKLVHFLPFVFVTWATCLITLTDGRGLLVAIPSSRPHFCCPTLLVGALIKCPDISMTDNWLVSNYTCAAEDGGAQKDPDRRAILYLSINETGEERKRPDGGGTTKVGREEDGVCWRSDASGPPARVSQQRKMEDETLKGFQILNRESDQTPLLSSGPHEYFIVLVEEE